MLKVSDYIAKFLHERGIEQVFSVVGGGSMYLNESFSKVFTVTYCHHEQACAIAAEGYYRASGKIACVLVTTGPGGLNTLTGVMGQWTDSIPVFYVSGQVRSDLTVENNRGFRQLGDQEVDIVSIVSPIVKKAITLKQNIPYCLDKMFSIMIDRRKGPVWVNVPMDIQSSMIKDEYFPLTQEEPSQYAGIPTAWKIFHSAKRPLIVAGHGIRLGGMIEEFREFIKCTHIPVVTTFNGFDILPNDCLNFIGRIGTVGTRAGNIALQNADVVLFLGTRNNIRQTSFNWKSFAKDAYKIGVDIDKDELSKPTCKYDLQVPVSVQSFLLHPSSLDITQQPIEWLDWCLYKRYKYKTYLSNDLDGIDLYTFFDHYTRQLKDCVGVASNGSACVGLFQAGIVKESTRYFWNSGCASMGYDLPAAIGASLGSNKTVYCFAGDGSMQMNLQELQTIVHNKLPIKILYLNNGGYVSIKQTQDTYFKHRTGCESISGVSFPDMRKVADAYGIPYLRVKTHNALEHLASKLSILQGPVICEVFLKQEYSFKPKLVSKQMPDGSLLAPSLENMYPFLSEEEMKENIYDEGSNEK